MLNDAGIKWKVFLTISLVASARLILSILKEFGESVARIQAITVFQVFELHLSDLYCFN